MHIFSGLSSQSPNVGTENFGKNSHNFHKILIIFYIYTIKMDKRAFYLHGHFISFNLMHQTLFYINSLQSYIDFNKPSVKNLHPMTFWNKMAPKWRNRDYSHPSMVHHTHSKILGLKLELYYKMPSNSISKELYIFIW